MGCCFSWCDESKSLLDESDERTRLISDPIINSSDGQRIPSESLVSPYQQSLPTKSDEQSMLNKILQQTANNVIDISTLGPHMMEQNEYLERRAVYSAKMDSFNNHLWHLYRVPPDFSGIEDSLVPEQLASQKPILDIDYFLVTMSSSGIAGLVKEIVVKHTEDLVVPFNVPQKKTPPHNTSNQYQNSELLLDQIL